MLCVKHLRLPFALLCVALLALFAIVSPSSDADEVHECSGIVFETPLSGEIPHDLAPGTYYLTGDCYLLRHVDIYGEVSICLNGYSVEVQGATTFHPRDGGALNFYDCTGESVVGYVGGTLNNHPLTLDAGGTVNIYGGHFYAKTNSNCVNSEGTVNIYGGVIESATDGYCAVRNNGTLNVFGGTVIGCDTVWQRYGGAINLMGNEFVLQAKTEALKYVWDENTVFNVTTPLYMWRMSPDAEFTSSEVEPFEYTMGTTYIEFAPMRYAVTLDYNGGSGEAELREYTCGETTVLPTDPVKDGYTFVGWCAEGDTSEVTVTEITPDARGELAYRAVWTENVIETEPPTAPAEAAEEPAVPETKEEPNRAPVFIAIGAAVIGASVALSRKKKK